MSTSNFPAQSTNNALFTIFDPSQIPANGKKVLKASQQIRTNSKEIVAAAQASTRVTVHLCTDSATPTTNDNVEIPNTNFPHCHSGPANSSYQNKTNCTDLINVCSEADEILVILPDEAKEIINDVANNIVSFVCCNSDCQSIYYEEVQGLT